MGRKHNSTFLQRRQKDCQQERCSTLLITREMQIKTTARYPCTLVRMTIIKSLQIISAGEGLKKRDPSYILGGHVNWSSHYGKQYGGSLKKTKNRIGMWSSNPTPWAHIWKRWGLIKKYIWTPMFMLLYAWNSPGKNTGVGCHSLFQEIFPTHLVCQYCRQILYRLSHRESPSVYSSTIYNNQSMEQPECPSTWMDKEDVVYTYNGIFLSHKKESNIVICSNMNGPRDYPTKWSQSERQTLHHFHGI